MKKKFAKPSKVDQEKVELEYHRQQPEEFDKLMAGAKPQRHVIRRQQRVLMMLETVAGSEDEKERVD